MTLYYYLTRLRERDIDTLTALTALLGTLGAELVREVEFIHSAVSELILLRDERLARAVFDHLAQFRHGSLWLHRQLGRYLAAQVCHSLIVPLLVVPPSVLYLPHHTRHHSMRTSILPLPAPY